MRIVNTILASTLGILALSGCSLMPFDWFSSNEKPAVVDATDPRIRYAEGRANLAANRLGLALSAFQRAHYEAPADSRIVNALGVTYDRLRRFDLAQKYYRQALLLDGGTATTLNNLGYSLLLSGELKSAAETLAQAIERGAETPEAATIRANIALLQERVGPGNVAERRAPATPDGTTPKVRLEPAGSNSHDLHTGQTRIAKAPIAPQLRFQPAPRKPKISSSNAIAPAAGTAIGKSRIAKAVVAPPTRFLPAPRKPKLGIAPSTSIALKAGTDGGQTRTAKAPVTPQPRFLPAPRKPNVDVASSNSVKLVVDTEDGQVWIAEPLVTPLLRPETPPRKPSIASSDSIEPADSTAAGRTRIAKAAVAPQLRLLPTPHEPKVVTTHSIALEVANGTGSHHLTQRVSEYFAGHGHQTVLRTNALSSDHSTSVIFYRTGEEDKARAIAALLPFAVDMYPVPTLGVEVKVLLGTDSLPFDDKLMASAREHHSGGKEQS